MTTTETPAQFPRVPKTVGAALIASAILTFYLGVLPSRVMDWAVASITTIF
jgi:hypothetical protein